MEQLGFCFGTLQVVREATTALRFQQRLLTAGVRKCDQKILKTLAHPPPPPPPPPDPAGSGAIERTGLALCRMRVDQSEKQVPDLQLGTSER